jgi:pimeloyl-ACP methyl ester carboxylesterase
VATTDGARIVVHDLTGIPDTDRNTDSDLEPVLFAHATMFTAAVWRPVVTRLRGVRAWAPDLRAHGDSAVAPDADVSWGRIGADLLEVVDRLELRAARAVGHSMGACALLLAELARPGTFAGLWLYDPVVRPAAAALVGDDELAAGARRRRETFPSHAAAVAHFGSKPPLDVLEPAALEAYVSTGFAPVAANPGGGDHPVQLRLSGEQEARVYEGGRHNGVFERLGEIGCPVIVAHGGQTVGGTLFPAEVVAGLPLGQARTYPHLGHFGPLQDPAALAADLQAWLARRPGERR